MRVRVLRCPMVLGIGLILALVGAGPASADSAGPPYEHEGADWSSSFTLTGSASHAERADRLTGALSARAAAAEPGPVAVGLLSANASSRAYTGHNFPIRSASWLQIDAAVEEIEAVATAEVPQVAPVAGASGSVNLSVSAEWCDSAARCEPFFPSQPNSQVVRLASCSASTVATLTFQDCFGSPPRAMTLRTFLEPREGAALLRVMVQVSAFSSTLEAGAAEARGAARVTRIDVTPLS